MTALPSHLPAFSFFGGSLFFSGGLFCPVAVSSSSRQQTFFFFGGSLVPFGSLSRSVAVSSSSRQQTFFFFGGSLFFSGGLFCPVAVSSSSRQQTFFFFGGSLFRSAVFFVPQRFSSVFFRVGGAFRPPLFRGLKYCKRSDKKRRPPLYAEAACQVPVAPGKCACRGRARRSPEIGPKPEVCSFDRRDGAQNRENELPARKRRLRAHGSLMW